jgi:hypothetical protein
VGNLKPVIRKLQRNISHVLLGMRKCNEAGFCCDTFTILVKSGCQPDVVEVVPISGNFLENLGELLEEWSMDPPGTSSASGRQIFTAVRDNFAAMGFPTNQSHNYEGAKDLMAAVALLVQVYSLGLVLYTGSHSQPFNHSIPRPDLTSITFKGFASKFSTGLFSSEICATQQELGCFGDMVGPVWVFRESQQSNRKEPHYLVATVEDLMDTWGRGYIESHPYTPAVFCSIRIGGGLLRPLASTDLRFATSFREGYIACHWEKNGPLQRIQSIPDASFAATDKLIIGSFSENTDCRFCEKNSFIASGSFLQELVVSDDCWKMDSRELKVQGGQFVSLSTGGTQKLVDGVTLKAAIWDKWTAQKNILVLASPWGMELSLCTGVARRILLKDLFQHSVVQFAAQVRPLEWARIRCHFEDIFIGTEPADFCSRVKNLAQTDFACYIDLWEFCNVALGVLYWTGSSPNLDAVKIWWPFDNETLCLQVNNGWPQLLKDAVDRASFAVATPKCLSLGANITCRDRELHWDHDIRHLQTAVTIDKTTKDRSKSHTNTNGVDIVHSERYLLGDGRLLVSTDGINAPKFSAQWQYWPPLPEFVKRKLVRGYLRESFSAIHPSVEVIISLKK